MQLPTKLLLIGWFIFLPLTVYAHESALPQKLEELSLKQISKRIYVVHGLHQLPDKTNKGFISNTGIILTDKGVVIVDSGGSLQVGRLILSKIRQLTKAPVIAVFNSHIHGDHWLGNAAFRESNPNLPIYAHGLAIERLKNGEADRWLDIIMNMTEKSAAGTEVVLPDHKLMGGESLNLDGTVFKVHHTGHAHSDSDIMVELPDARVLFTGDIVEHGRLVSSDVPQDFNIKGQIEAIEYAMKLPVDIFVPGHGISGNQAIPQAALQFLNILHASVKRLYEEGMEDFEMYEQVAQDLGEFSKWYNFDQLGKLISYVYLQVEQADFQ